MADANKLNKMAPSILSQDCHVVGQISSTGDIQIEGRLDGNLLSHAVTVGESAEVNGEIAGEIVTIRGRVDGTIRARQVHLCASCLVTGDIYHESFAVESGAHFDGQVKHQDNPLASVAIDLPTQPDSDLASDPVAND